VDIPHERPLEFDLAGLVISLLVKLEALKVSITPSGWPTVSVDEAIEKVSQGSVVGPLRALWGAIRPAAAS
jgi:hypothetical protein